MYSNNIARVINFMSTVSIVQSLVVLCSVGSFREIYIFWTAWVLTCFNFIAILFLKYMYSNEACVTEICLKYGYGKALSTYSSIGPNAQKYLKIQFRIFKICMKPNITGQCWTGNFG